MEAARGGSVTKLLKAFEARDEEAIRRIWDRYFHQMVAIARSRLGGTSCRAADEEDVAITAFDSFCRGLHGGRYPQMRDRNDLWAALVTMTLRKAIDQVVHQGRQKRGGQYERAAGEQEILDNLFSREPLPEVAATMQEECERLLDLLEDDGLRKLTLHRLEGHNSSDIAERLGCSRVTVQRRLRLIRQLWEQEFPR